MRIWCRVLVSAGVLLLGANAPLAGQRYGGAFGIYGGGSWFSDLLPEDDAAEARMATSWVAGLQIERWLGSGRVGLRFGAEYTGRELEEPVVDDFNVYSGELSLLFRLLSPDVRRSFAPYFALGGGAAFFNAAVGPYPPIGYYEDPVTRPMATIGLGADLFARSPVGLELEVADRILIESPFGDPATSSRIRPVHQATVRLVLEVRSDRRREAPPVLAALPEGRADAADGREAPAATPPAAEPPAAEPPAAEPPVEQAGGWDGPAMKAPAEPEAHAAPDPDAQPPAMVLAGLAAAVDANTAELERLRARIDDFGRMLEQRLASAAGAPVTAAPWTGRLYTVQIGAFRSADSAQRLAEQVRRTDGPVWVSQAVVNGQTFHRVRLGAHASLAEARHHARQVRDEYGVPVWVAPVRGSEVPAAATVSATARTTAPKPAAPQGAEPDADRS
ncbi:MAG TPA: SPOR domain-containing protein [Longimicrobiales bacterium]